MLRKTQPALRPLEVLAPVFARPWVMLTQNPATPPPRRKTQAALRTLDVMATVFARRWVMLTQNTATPPRGRTVVSRFITGGGLGEGKVSGTNCVILGAAARTNGCFE